MDEFDRFQIWLDTRAAEDRPLRLWLRDDDAVALSAPLDRLLSAMNRHNVPGLLAVIPEGVTPALAARIATEPLVYVAPHGWAHVNHQPAGAKKSEFGADRPIEDSAADFRTGRAVVEAAFGSDALPIFVPPWNRIGDRAMGALAGAGYAALSVFGAAKSDPLPQINTHVDLIDWRGTRGGRAADALLSEVMDWAEADEPAIGFLTHHLVHDETAWNFVERFLAVTSRHAAVRWVSPAVLLDGSA